MNPIWDDYIKRLLAQGQGLLHICPDCLRRGQRKFCCTNLVVIHDNGTLRNVCCYLGDKHDLTRKEFRKKVRVLQKHHRV